jgi:hypothetical protein
MYDLQTANYYISMIKKHSEDLTTYKAMSKKWGVSDRFLNYFRKGERQSKPLFEKVKKDFYRLQRYCTWVAEQSEVYYGKIVVVWGEQTAEDLKEKINTNGDVLYYNNTEYFFIDKKYGFKDCKKILDLILEWMKATESKLTNDLEFLDLMMSNTTAPKTLRKYILKHFPEF